MEKARKKLKTESLLVLLFAALSLIQVIAELWFGELSTVDAPENLVRITQIILLVVTVLFTLPKVYVGIRGLRIAKNPVATKGHIVWAIIIFVFSALGLIEPVIGFVQQGDTYENISALFSVLLEMTIYFDYIMCARAVRKEYLQEAE